MSHPTDLAAMQAAKDLNPFENMKIDDTNILDTLDGRNPCSKCGKSRKYFCYTCYVPIPQLSNVLPNIKLPIKIDIIKHKNETDGKSTACHAAILASEDVTIYTYPDIPEYDTEEKVVLIFPSAKALSIQQIFSNELESNIEESVKKQHRGTLMKELSENVRNNYSSLRVPSVKELPVRRAVFIDSTWNQSRGIYKDERIRKLPCVVIHNRISQFWRHQKGSPRWYLATIEAIHQFLIEIHVVAWGVDRCYSGLQHCLSDDYIKECSAQDKKGDAYNGQYDNLLFFFKHMYNLIHTYYEHEQLYAYQRRLM